MLAARGSNVQRLVPEVRIELTTYPYQGVALPLRYSGLPERGKAYSPGTA